MSTMSDTARQQRIDWLIANKSMWQGFPQSKREKFFGDDKFQEKHKMIVDLMKSEGLLSKTTWWRDFNIVWAINEARRQIRERK